MYCVDCGIELKQDANFCSSCGISLKEGVTKATPHANHLPMLEAKPAMITWLTLARYFPLQVNLTICGGVLFGLLMVMIQLVKGTLLHPYRPFIFFGIMFFVSVPLIVYLSYKKTAEDTRYQFYANRMEYYQGFWSLEHKVVYYKHISNVTLHRNIFQRLAGVGSIHLATPDMGARSRGVTIPDLKNSEKIFQQVQKILKEY